MARKDLETLAPFAAFADWMLAFTDETPITLGTRRDEFAKRIPVAAFRAAQPSQAKATPTDEVRDALNRLAALTPRELTDEEAERGFDAYALSRFGPHVSKIAAMRPEEKAEARVAICAAYRAITEEADSDLRDRPARAPYPRRGA